MFRSVRDEIIKILGQKKNYVVMVGHLLLLGLCYLGFKTTNLHFFQDDVTSSSGLQIKDIMAYIDGLFFARAAIVPTYFILFPIFIATLAGDIVAGEVQEGTLKLYASRDRSRTHILLAKLLAVFVMAVAYSFYFAILNVVVGVIFFGINPVQLVFLRHFGLDTDLVLMTPWQSLGCYFVSVCYYAVSIMALGTVTVFFSTLFDRMTAATVAGITVYFVCYIVGSMPFAKEIQPYLISTAMNGVFVFWMERLPVGRLIDNLCLLGLYISCFTAFALVHFNYKDIK